MTVLSLRLTHKITAIGIIGVVGIIVVGCMHLYGESAMANYRKSAEGARELSELDSKIEIGLLEARRAEKDFLLRGDQKKIEKQAEISKSVVADIETLRNKLVAIGKPDLVKQIEAMRAG